MKGFAGLPEFVSIAKNLGDEMRFLKAASNFG